jgi:hypothetical protein
MIRFRRVSSVEDAALIVNGNFVEHYEIALYGSLAAFAKNLGRQDAAQLLNETWRKRKRRMPSFTNRGDAARPTIRQAPSGHQQAIFYLPRESVALSSKVRHKR